MLGGGALSGWLGSLLGADEPETEGDDDEDDEEIRNKLEQLGYLE